MRKAIVGDEQNISIDFDEAKAGEVYKVQVIIERPDGTTEERYVDFKFYEKIERENANS